jgi:PKD repeat protein
MKHPQNALWALLALCFYFSISQLSAQRLPDYRIEHTSHSMVLPENVEGFVQRGQLNRTDEVNGRFYQLLQFYFIPNQEEKAAIAAAGIELLNYIPNNVYTASIPTDLSPEILQELGVRSMLPLSENWKLAPRLEHEDYGDWATDKGEIQLLLTYFSDIDQKDIRAYCTSDRIEVLAGNGQTNVLRVRVSLNRIREVAQLPYVAYLDQVPEPGEPEDTRGASIHRANAIDTRFSGGRQYTGTGIAVQTRDDGAVGPHIDFQGRLINITNNPGGTHGDGVSGIFAGAGNLDPYMRGMAAGAQLYVTDYVSDFLDTTLALHLQNNVLVTNSSYSNGCNAGYTTTTQTVDQQMYLNPTYLHVYSAGNSNNQDCGYGAGNQWGNITGGHKQGTNVIATANLEQDLSLRFSSSHGPAHDGRIKPDIAANGHEHMSTNPDNTYISFGGTSGAAPGIAGITAQLHQAYQELNGGETAQAALLKAILLNTANDMGNPGPDYFYGWGHVNALRAVRVLEEERYFSGVVDQGEGNVHSFVIPENTRQAKIMVYWHDFPAQPEAEHALINDLDARVFDVFGNEFQPFVLDTTANPSLLSLPAVPGDDHINNVEQIALDDPEAGLYYLNVDGFNVPMGPVEYFVVLEFLTDEVELIYPYGGEGLAPGTVVRSFWDAYGNTDPFMLELSTDNGASWTILSDNIPNDTRFFDWTVPDELTGEALVRLSRGSSTDETEAVFSIIPVPANLEVTQACPDFIRLEWEEVAEATHYDVFQLGDLYMDSVGTTTDLVFDFPTTNLDPSLDYWFSVRAVVPDQAIIGERAIAVPHNGGLLNCTQQVDLSVQEINLPQVNFFTLCEGEEFNIAISGFNEGLTSQSTIEVGYSINGTTFTEPLGETLDPGDGYAHAFSQPISVSSTGTYELLTWIHVADDSAVFNDTTETQLIITYYPGTGAALDITEDFESPSLPDYWSVVNEDLGFGWERLKVVGITGDSTFAYFIDNYSYSNSSDSKDKVITVPIDLTDPALINPALFFDLCAADYPSDNYSDTLRIDIYTDCSKTFGGTVYEKWAGDLATVGAIGSEYYPESGEDWITEYIDLTPFLGESIVIEFVDISGWGNSVFLDNINIVEAAAPIAGFPLLPDTICPLIEYEFESTSTGIDLSLEWDFGTGAVPPSASGPGPHLVSYPASGFATIQLTATNSLGSDTFEQTVFVQALPEPDFNANTVGSSVMLENMSQFATSYLWDFGDGVGSSLETAPMYTYAEDGTYTITLMASNACGTVTITENVTIITPPTASFSADPLEGCTPLTVAFSDNSSENTTAWNWTFTGGTPSSSTEQNPVVEYTSPGVYSVELEVSNSEGSDQVSQLDIIMVADLPNASFTQSLDGLTVALTNTSANATSYSWDFGDGVGTSTETDPVYTYTEPGEYTITLSATNVCATVEATSIIQIIVDGIEETTDHVAFQLFPNPSNGRFMVTVAGAPTETVELQIFDLTGRLFYQQSIQSVGPDWQIPVDLGENVPSGMYLLRLRNGNQHWSRKIIIE